MGTLSQFAQSMAQSFQQLSPAQQEQTRKAMYESVTKKAVPREALNDELQKYCDDALAKWKAGGEVSPRKTVT